MHPKLDYSELTNTVYIVFGNNHHKKIDVTDQFNRLRTILIPLKQDKCNVCFDEWPETCPKCSKSGEPGNEVKKESDMDKLTIYRFQAKQIEDTFRLVQRIFECHKKESSVDRDVMASWQMIKNVLSGKIDEHVSRI